MNSLEQNHKKQQIPNTEPLPLQSMQPQIEMDNSENIDTIIENENPKEVPKENQDKVEFKLLNQGSFGCIYSPEISCDGKVGNPNYISKIQLYSSGVDNEMNIGKKIIMNIHNHEYRFSPILSGCPANIDVLGERIEKEKCKIFNKETPNTSDALKTINASKIQNTLINKNLISTKIKYVAGDSLDVYFKEYIDYMITHNAKETNTPPTSPEIISSVSTNIITKIATTYLYLLESLQKLVDTGIIHYDIKDPNIIYDVNLHVPIIIDYGISFIPSETNTPEKQKDVFYTSKFYPYWSFDVFVLSYIVNDVRYPKPPSIIEDPKFTTEKLDKLINEYMEKTDTFLKDHAFPLTTEDIELFKMNQKKYYEKFKEKTWEDVFIDVFKPEVYNTWDNYSIAYTYFSLQKLLRIYDLNNANADEIMKLWKSIILSGPDNRKTIAQTIEELKKINILEYKPSDKKSIPELLVQQQLPLPQAPLPQTVYPPGPPAAYPPAAYPPAAYPPAAPPGQNKIEMLANVGMGAVAINEIAKNIDELDNII